MKVYLSKFHPDFPVDPTGQDYPFKMGDKATYISGYGSEWDGTIVVIDSELMYSDKCKLDARVKAGDGLVYEVVFSDGRHAAALERLHHIRGHDNSIDGVSDIDKRIAHAHPQSS